MKKSSIRPILLCFGMVCFLLAVSASLVNVLFFPYARNLHNMTFPRLYVVFAAYLFILFAFSRFLKHTDAAELEHRAKMLVPAFLLISLLLMFICGFLLAYEPFCDNAVVFRSAELISQCGKITPQMDESVYKYLLHFPNQWGFVLLLSLLPFKPRTTPLSSTHILYLLSGIQALLFAASFLALLHTVKRRFGVRAQLMLLFSIASFLPHYPAAAVLYTDTFSMPFVILALCCMLHIDQNTPRQYLILFSIGCGLSLLIGCMIKMTCLILFLAAAIVWLLTLHPKRAAVCMMIPLLILSSGTKSMNSYMANHILNPDDVTQYETPLLHWVMMSIPTDDNRYGTYLDDYSYTWSLMEEGASREEIMQSIYTRIHERLMTFQSIKDVIYALLCKNANYIGSGTFGLSEMLDDAPLRRNLLSSFVLFDGTFYSLYADLCGGIWLAHLAVSVLVCLKHIQKRCFHFSIPMIAFLGLLIFEMFWEARNRYLFNFAPLILLTSSCGLVYESTKGGFTRS